MAVPAAGKGLADDLAADELDAILVLFRHLLELFQRDELSSLHEAIPFQDLSRGSNSSASWSLKPGSTSSPSRTSCSFRRRMSSLER
jgi:hypothetical protein